MKIEKLSMKKSILLLSILLFILNGNAQNSEIKWDYPINQNTDGWKTSKVTMSNFGFITFRMI